MNEAGPIADSDEAAAAPVFVSFSSENHRKAMDLCKGLEARGVSCWISSRDVAPGENYQEAIVRAIKHARAMVLIFSEAANRSDEIKKELSLASRHRIPVIAARIEDVEPSDAFAYELSTRQWIDAFGAPRQALDALVSRLRDAPTGDRSGSRPSAPVGTRLTRRHALIAGGALAAGAGGLTWFWRRDRLPAEAQALLDDGHHAMNEGTVEQFAAAAERFRQATRIAPGHAEPWGALALAYERQANGAPSAESRNLHSRSAEARRHALSIDPTNGDALASLAFSMQMFGNWAAVEKVCRKGLQSQPDHPVLNGYLGVDLAQVGRTSEALVHMSRAVQANPKFVDAIIFKTVLLEDLDRLDEASATIESAMRTWPRQYGVWFTRLYNLSLHGKPVEALAMIDDRATRPTGIPEWNFEITRLQTVALMTRNAADMEAAMKRTMETAVQATGFAENAMMFAGMVGRVDEAYKIADGYFFDKGFKLPERRFSDEQGVYTAHRHRLTQPLLRRFMRPVQMDPRFGPLLSAIGLKNYWSATGTRPDYLAWLAGG